jgi:hypothetical protein
LIFDLEIIFLFPLASVLFSLGSLLAFWVVMIFLIILTIGFLYEWFHGALEIVLFYTNLNLDVGSSLPRGAGHDQQLLVLFLIIVIFIGFLTYFSSK